MEYNYEALFLLGAGASKPYGYPTGLELKNQIIDQCIHGGSLIGVLTALGFDRDLISDFGIQFRYASTPSIDAFLKNRNQFTAIGKTIIAYFILEAERDINKHFPPDHDWLGHLLGKVIENKRKSFENTKLNFITFNYDRVLQFRLLKCIEARFGLGSTEAAKLVKNFMIHHVYGSLGDLPEIYPGKAHMPMQVGNIIPNYCRIAGQSIKVMHEERAGEISDTKLDPPTKDYIYHSKKIFILGFGFDGDNMKTLDIDWSKVTGQVFATAYGCGDGEIAQIKNLMEGCIDLQIEKWTALEMLKEKLIKI